MSDKSSSVSDQRHADDAEGEMVLLEDLCVSLRTHARAGNFLCCWNAIVAIARLAGSEEAARSAIDAVDEHGETALTLAVVHGNARLVQTLLQKGADSEHRPSPDIPSPLVRAAAAGHSACVKVLRHQSPEISFRMLDATFESGEFAGHNALTIAAYHGHFLVCRELLEQDPIADVNSGPYHGAALLEAAVRGHGHVVDILLQHGCDPDCHRVTGRISAICCAAENKHWPVCALLVAYGADVEELADPNALVEVTAFSASLELDDAVERLLQRCNQLQLDLDIVLEQGCTLLTAAVACGNVLGVDALLAKGASPDAPDGRGNTPLSIAAALGLCDAVKALLAAGANPDTKTEPGQEQPLRIAVHLWYASVREALARHGSAASSPDDDLCVSVNDDLTDRALGVVNASDDVFDFGDDIHDETAEQLEEGMVLGIVPDAGAAEKRTNLAAVAAAVAADALAAEGDPSGMSSSLGGGSLIDGAASDGTEMSVTEVSAQTLVQTHALQPVQTQARWPLGRAHHIDLEPSATVKAGLMGVVPQPGTILSAAGGGDSEYSSSSSALLVAKSPREADAEDAVLIVQPAGPIVRGAIDAMGGCESVITLSTMSVESSLNSQEISFGIGSRRHIFNAFAFVQAKVAPSPCGSQASASSSASCMAMVPRDGNTAYCGCRGCSRGANAICEFADRRRATLHDSLQSWPELEVSPDHRRHPHVVVVQQKATALRPYYRPDSFRSHSGCGMWFVSRLTCGQHGATGVSGCTGWSTASSRRRERALTHSDQGSRPPRGCWTSALSDMWTCMTACMPQGFQGCYGGQAGSRNVSSQASSFDVAPAVEIMKMPNSLSPLGGYQSSGADSSIHVPAGYDSRTIENAAFADDTSPHSDIRSSLRSSPLGRPMVTMEAAMNDVEFDSADSALSGLSRLSPPDSPSATANVEVFVSDVAGRTPDRLAAEAEAQGLAVWAAGTPELVCSPVANTASAGSSGSGPEGPSLSPTYMTPTGSTPSFFRDGSGRIDAFSWNPSQDLSGTCSRSSEDVLHAAPMPTCASTELAGSIPEDAPVEDDCALRPAAGAGPAEQAMVEEGSAQGGAVVAGSHAAQATDVLGEVGAAELGGSSGDLAEFITSITDDTVDGRSAGVDVAGESSTDYADTSGLDVSMTPPHIDNEASKTSSDVSGSCVSLMCPHIFTASDQLDPGKDAPLPPVWPPAAAYSTGTSMQPQAEATSLSLSEQLPMHGDITDSDELGSGLMGTAAGHTAPVVCQAGGLRESSDEAPGVFVPSDVLNLSLSSRDGVFVPGNDIVGLLDNGKEGRGVRFRMDGDMGLKSCVKVLFLASQKARSTVGEEMSQVLVDHGVVSAVDMQKAC